MSSLREVRINRRFRLLLDPVRVATVGDSFGNDPTEWPARLAAPDEVLNYATSGHRLITQIEGQLDTALLEPRLSAVVVQGGVNDLNQGTLAVNMETALTSMVSKIQSKGLVAIVIGVGPWKNYVSWSASDQTQTDLYNTWLTDNAAALGFSHVNIYTALEDGGAPDELAAAYDAGDGLHPSVAGSQLIADAVDAALVAAGVA